MAVRNGACMTPCPMPRRTLLLRASGGGVLLSGRHPPSLSRSAALVVGHAGTRCTGPCPIRQTPADQCMPRAFTRQRAFRPQMFVAAVNKGDAGSDISAQFRDVAALLARAQDLFLDKPETPGLVRVIEGLESQWMRLMDERQAAEAAATTSGAGAAAGGGMGAAGEPTYTDLRFILPGSSDIDAVLLVLPARGQPFITNQEVLEVLKDNEVIALSDVTAAFELGLSSEVGEDVTPPTTFKPVKGTEFIDGHIYWTYVKGGWLPEVTGWMRAMIRGFETTAALKGLAVMRESHPKDHVERVCQEEFQLADGGKMKLAGLIDAGACVLVVEAQPRITKDTVKEVESKLAKIKSIQSTDPLAHLFYNKEVKVAIAGHTLDEHARDVVQEKIGLGWQVWLPDATGRELRDASFGAT